MLKLGNPHDVQLAGMWSGSIVPGFSSLIGMVVSFMREYASGLMLFNNVRKSDEEDSSAQCVRTRLFVQGFYEPSARAQLVFWLKWEKADTALTYTRTRDLAKTMGITILPN
jgi:hypothetical protein